MSLLAIVEMNLEEYPAFRLGRRSKRPELRYLRSRTDAEGHAIEQVWVVRGVEGLGLPGPFEQDLYVALLVLFTEQGLPADGRIRFTRNRIAQLMEISNSGRGYELIEQGLRRLAGASVHSEHSFYRPGVLVPRTPAERAERATQADRPQNGKGRAGVQRGGPAERLSLDFHILEEVRVYERGTPLVFEDGNRVARVDRAKPFELSVARLGQPLVQSYERRYTKTLDASFYFGLKGPLAKRLYRYVDKVRNGRGAFEIGLRALGDVLGLEYRYPSDIKAGLTDAHAELRERNYLTNVHLAPLAGGPNAGEKVVYAFNPAFGQRGKKRVSVPPTTPPPEIPALQLALETFGVSAKRAAALVEQFPKDHIAARLEHVRARSKDQKAAPLRNPAGYLAKSIEDSFTVGSGGRTNNEHSRSESAGVRGWPGQGAASESPRNQARGLGAGECAPATAGGSAEGRSLGSVPWPAEPQPHVVVTAPSESDERVDPTPDGIWGQLAERLRTKLSGATYAAFVSPALLAAPEASGELSALTLPLPSPFSFEKWHRAPIKAALAEATAELGITLTLTLLPA